MNIVTKKKGTLHSDWISGIDSTLMPLLETILNSIPTNQ
jgi:hypothetical protein